MKDGLKVKLNEWLAAGLLDAASADRIHAFETQREEGLRWPMLLAIAFGALMVGSGVLLFVAAHWENLSPGARFACVLGMVALSHGGGAMAASSSPRLATALHGVGTLSLGAGIFLAGQIFHLQEHWPGGVLLWALGAWAGWGLLRDWVQGTLTALLTPAWLMGEWIEATLNRGQMTEDAGRLLAMSALLLAVTYFSARRDSEDSLLRKALAWVGGLALIPCVLGVIGTTHEIGEALQTSPMPGPMLFLGWSLGVGGPLALAYFLRRREARWNLLAALWAWLLGIMSTHELPIYLWCALGATGLVAWGLREARRERVNLGIAGFAITLFAFYFSSIMDKLGRSLGLIGLGLLFLLGGWQLERLRRSLNARIQGGAP